MNATGQHWKRLADELRRTNDTNRMKELVMLLEEAIFNRQQELALSGEKNNVQQEERDMRKALDLMLEIKTKKLGFPDIH